MDTNVLFGKELFETGAKLASQWGITEPNSRVVRTPLGDVAIQHLVSESHVYIKEGWVTVDIVQYVNHKQDWESEWGDEPLKYYIDGDYFWATNKLVQIAEYLASDDWRKKIDGSIGLLKRVHDAIKG